MASLRSVVLALLVISVTPRAAQPGREYGLNQQKIARNRVAVRVYDRRTGRTIWRRTMENPTIIRWSRDGSAVAVVDELDSGSPWWWRLVTWHAGERVRSYRHLTPFRSFEAVTDVVWSPDEMRLLLIGPRSMGEADLGLGSLWCLRLADARATRVAFPNVTRAQWLSPTRLRYWTGRYVKRKPTGNTHTLAESSHEASCR